MSKPKVHTYSFCLSPATERRWRRFAENVGLNKSTALAQLLPKVLDAWEEAEHIETAPAFRKASKTNKSCFHSTESGFRMLISLEMDFSQV